MLIEVDVGVVALLIAVGRVISCDHGVTSYSSSSNVTNCSCNDLIR